MLWWFGEVTGERCFPCSTGQKYLYLIAKEPSHVQNAQSCPGPYQILRGQLWQIPWAEVSPWTIYLSVTAAPAMPPPRNPLGQSDFCKTWHRGVLVHNWGFHLLQCCRDLPGMLWKTWCGREFNTFAVLQYMGRCKVHSAEVLLLNFHQLVTQFLLWSVSPSHTERTFPVLLLGSVLEMFLQKGTRGLGYSFSLAKPSFSGHMPSEAI